MLPHCVNPSVFDIPHLRDDITRYLLTNDLAHCILVSKEWSIWFTPALWKVVDLRKGIAETEHWQSTLKNHRGHIESIITRNKYVMLDTVSLFPFPNLRSLDYYTTMWISLEESRILDILSASPSLQRLDISLEEFEPGSAEKFNHALKSHPNLRNLGLTFSKIWTPLFVPQLLKACQQFELLHLRLYSRLEVELTEEEEDGIYLKVKTEVEGIEDMRVRDLLIQFHTPKQEQSILVPLLNHCPLLESFGILEIHYQGTLQLLSGVFQDNKCPRLRRLRLPSTGQYGETTDPILDLFRAIKHGCGTTNDGIGGERTEESGGIEFFGGYSLFTLTQPRAYVLAECFANSLTALDLSYQCEIQFAPFVALVSGLPRLLSLNITVSIVFQLSSDGDSDIKAALDLPWSCLQLSDFSLRLQSPIQNGDIDGMDGMESVQALSDQCTVFIFEQMGRMKSMKEWKFRTNRQDILMLDNGYLDRLSGWNQLKGLDIRRTGLGLDSKEAEWMILNWPKLIHVEVNHQMLSLRPKKDILAAFKNKLSSCRPWMLID
ncbi:hypothetical protein BGX27_010080 [Mortierella sp. AM989]|nr:hypothetical protein BGX27_010080 [Mortierella sp. AM989]